MIELPMIEFRNVYFSIDEKDILTNVSFHVPRGQTRVILGPSGSGKSTILRLLLGLWQPDSGNIFVNGEDITQTTPERLREIRRMMAIVFQQGALFDSMTVGENIGYTLLEDRHDEEEIEKAVETYLTQVGLDPGLRDSMPDELSGGMQRRVAIARALAARNPEILLYDEPTTGLDPQSAERITDLINDLRDRLGKTSIMVTHDIADAFKAGNRTTVLDRGIVVFEGTPAELNAADNPFIAEFLAPFRKAVAAATRRMESGPPTSGMGRGESGGSRPQPGGSP
jgi:phospholipid/cholesterol/gamma-HCH transport system ATP-binding protein